MYFSEGVKLNPLEKDLMWEKNKLFIEEAPEPDDVDWESIHISTHVKLQWRAWCLLVRIIFMTISFVSISAIAKY